MTSPLKLNVTYFPCQYQKAIDDPTGVPSSWPITGNMCQSYDLSRAATEKLTVALTEGAPLSIDEHVARTQAVKKEAKKQRDLLEDETLHRTLARFPEDRQRAIGRSVVKWCQGSSSGWLSAVPLKQQNFDLSPCEFRDALAIRYKRRPPDMPMRCDGCGHWGFTLGHALSCKTGGLVTRRHNEVRDVLGDVIAEAWGNCVREPTIVEPNGPHPGLRGDLACRGVWEPQRVALFDVRVLDSDAPSYGSRAVLSVLSAAEEEKKRKYLNACEERHATFTPLVCTADAVFAPQMNNFIKHTAERLADRWLRPYSTVMGWLRPRLAFAILRASSMCLRGSRTKWRPAGELLGMSDGAALQLGLN